jgi:hypothetical protein
VTDDEVPTYDVMPGGHRRIDRVLAADYLAGITALPLDEVRALRAEAEQEEADCSYVRRMLQGRIDIVRAEQRRRSGEGPGDLVAALPTILADAPRPTPRGLGRHQTVEPSRVDEHRRRIEQLIADVGLSDVDSRSDDDLERALRLLQGAESSVSEKRRQVQAVADACAEEIARRYRDGEADVSDLLAGVPPAE